MDLSDVWCVSCAFLCVNFGYEMIDSQRGAQRRTKYKKQNGWKPVCFVRPNSCWITETKWKKTQKTKARLYQLKRGWMSGEIGQMKENSTLNWRSTSTKITIKIANVYFTLKYVPKMDLFLIRTLQLTHDVLKFSNCTRLRLVQFWETSLVSIYHEMYLRSYSFLYISNKCKWNNCFVKNAAKI